MKNLELIKYENPDFQMNVEPELAGAYNSDSFELASRKILLELIKENSNFIDVGGHYGFYSLLASKKITSGNIFSFEPVPDNAEIFKKNIALNDFKLIKLFDKAVSNKSEEKDFFVSESSDSSGFTPHPRAKTLKKTKVKTVILDEIFGDKKIDVVKIDTEGHELGVIEGMEKIIKNNPQLKIIMEFNPKCIINAKMNPLQIFAVLRKLDFDIYIIKDAEEILIDLTDNYFDWNNYLDSRLYANLLCLKKKEMEKLLKTSIYFKETLKISGNFNGGEASSSKLPKDIPLISVIIPSRVGEKIETLPSLKNQTYKNIEIIIKYDEKKEGVSVVRNRGAKKAKGKYLFFCDNDLELSPTCISDLYLSLKYNPEAKWAFGKFLISSEGVYNENKDLDVPKNEKSVEFIEWFRGISTMSLIDASIKPVFDEGLKKFNDWDLWLTIYKKGYKPVFCNKILFETDFKSGGVSLAEDAAYWLYILYEKHGISLVILGRYYKNLLINKDQEVFTISQAIQQKDQMIRQKGKEISMMKSSSLWKMRQKYVKLKRMLKL